MYNPINAREKYNKENSHVVFAFDNIASVPPCTRILLTSARSGERGEPVSWPRWFHGLITIPVAENRSEIRRWPVVTRYITHRFSKLS